MPATVLIVDDEKHTREGLAAALEDEYDVYTARSADEAFRLLDSESFDIVLTDLRMAGKSGLTVIDKAVKLPYQPVVIMMTAYGNVESAVEAMKRGAFDFLTKPLNLEKLEILIKRALKSRRLETENKELHERLDQRYSFDGVVGNSPGLQRVLREIRQVAPSRATVMLYGETGTGKELAAQMIHQNSPRSRLPFVPVHCAAIPANLLESELFGHEKGAFTGATERRIGRFEAADGGTLFLDEIGEIDAPTQVKLLRFIESRTFERVGSLKPMHVDVRLICATNRDLAAMVAKGEFREDLYYRLNVIPLTLPPLRERREDIPLLLRHYMDEMSRENGLKAPEIAPSAMRVLENYRWPGNIRELRNFVENVVVMRRGAQLTEYDLDPKFLDNADPGQPADTSVSGMPPSPPVPGKRLSKEENERRLFRQALQEAGGNRTRAAQMIGISRRTLHRKLKQWPDLDV